MRGSTLALATAAAIWLAGLTGVGPGAAQAVCGTEARVLELAFIGFLPVDQVQIEAALPALPCHEKATRGHRSERELRLVLSTRASPARIERGLRQILADLAAEGSVAATGEGSYAIVAHRGRAPDKAHGGTVGGGARMRLLLVVDDADAGALTRDATTVTRLSERLRDQLGGQGFDVHMADTAGRGQRTRQPSLLAQKSAARIAGGVRILILSAAGQAVKGRAGHRLSAHAWLKVGDAAGVTPVWEGRHDAELPLQCALDSVCVGRTLEEALLALIARDATTIGERLE